MSSPTGQHHNQHYSEYEFHSGLIQNGDLSQHGEYHHEAELDNQVSMLPDAIIRGNMQYINGELRKIPRPLNAFMIFSNEKRKELKKEFPGEPNNMISSRLGAAWKGLSDQARKKYHDMAHREDLEHRRKYPNYQYCPGHARKLKKARREQRLRQQGLYRGSRQSGGKSGAQGAPTTRRRAAEMAKQKQLLVTETKPEITKEKPAGDSQTSPVAKRPSTNSSVVHGIGSSMVSPPEPMAPGPYGDGGYSSAGFLPPPDGSAECLLSCCSGCKAADLYCCSDSPWNTDALAASQGFLPAAYPPPMLYFSPGYESQYAGDGMIPQPCLMSGDCSGCYSSGYVDGCYGPMYPAGGESGMMYKDLCFIPSESQMTSLPTALTPLSSVDVIGIPTSDNDADLTDISNNMVASVSQDSQTSQNSSGSKETMSPGTLQEISPPSTVMCAAELCELGDN